MFELVIPYFIRMIESVKDMGITPEFLRTFGFRP